MVRHKTMPRLSKEIQPYANEIDNLFVKSNVLDAYEKSNILTTMMSQEESVLMEKVVGNSKSLEKKQRVDIALDTSELAKFNKSSLIKYIEKMIAKGFDIEKFDKERDETLLMYAARTGNFSLVKFVLRKKASIDTKNSKGENAFLIAAKNGHFEIMDFLNFHGSSWNSRDHKGVNALHFATVDRNYDLICRIVEKGIKINSKDLEGKTALNYAIAAGDMDTVIMLI